MARHTHRRAEQIQSGHPGSPVIHYRAYSILSFLRQPFKVTSSSSEPGKNSARLKHPTLSFDPVATALGSDTTVFTIESFGPAPAPLPDSDERRCKPRA